MNNVNRNSVHSEPRHAQYLDEMIRLSLLYAEEQRSQEIISQAEHIPELSRDAQLHILNQAWQKAENDRAIKHQQHRKAKLKHLLRRAVSIAAALILLIGLSLSIGIASSEAFRSYVIQLLYSFNHAEGIINYHYLHSATSFMHVPNDWTGNFYPSYIPDGFAVTDYRHWPDNVYTITLTSSNGSSIIFEEVNREAWGTTGTEGGIIESVNINGHTGIIRYAEDESYVAIDWPTDICWLSLYADGITLEQALEIANSVVYIK